MMTYIPDDRFSWFLKQFGKSVKYTEATETMVLKYRNVLPEQILTYWQEYGFCQFKEGLFSIVNPDKYKSIMDLWTANSEIPEEDNYHVIAKSGFGDLYLWGEKSGNNYIVEPKNLYIYQSKSDKKRILAGSENEAMQGFFATKSPKRIDLIDVDTDKPIFTDAVKKFGPLAPDEMFTFEPALFLGGEQTLKTVNKVNIFVQLELLAKMGTPQIMDINGLAKKAFS